MPRKKKGWGNNKSLEFKAFKQTSKSKALRNSYGSSAPSKRSFGTTVSRGVIEQYDINSNWAKWRKGYEYYVNASWAELLVPNPYFGVGSRLDGVNPDDPNPGKPFTRATLESILYQGTTYELPTLFYGWEFPTKKSDTNTHYVAKRTPQQEAKLGVITEVWNDPNKYPEQFFMREIWAKGIPDVNARLLLQMEGERVTDGETEGTLKYVLTQDQLPAVYKGKTFPSDVETDGFNLEATKVSVRIPIEAIEEGTQEAGKAYTTGQGLNQFLATKSASEILANTKDLIGSIIYVPDFYVERSIDDIPLQVWADSIDYFGTVVGDIIDASTIYCLDTGVETLPPSMYDITELPTLFKATGGQIRLTGTFIFEKKQYNRFFPGDYVLAEQVQDLADEISYSILPFTISAAYIEDGFLYIDSLPFASELKIYPALTGEAYLVFTDYSLAKYKWVEKDEVRELDKAIPDVPIPGTPQYTGWREMNIDVQAWETELFTTGNPIEPAETFTCSCPDYAHSILAIPQSTMDEGERKTNRQLRYPLPSAMGLSRWEALGIDQVAGQISTWATQDYRNGLKLCKHSIAARYIEKIKLIEPSEYPSFASRIPFEQKLAAEVEAFLVEFKLSYARSQLSLREIIFALAQGLNLDNIETAYVLFNSY